jgi:ribosomal protein S12 methylthiotransferase accessory factor
VVLECLEPTPEGETAVVFGKGLNPAQARASACLEFIERLNAHRSSFDEVIQSTWLNLDGSVINPEEFCLAPDSQYAPGRSIDWVWGFSLTRGALVQVPANLVYCPYSASGPAVNIAWPDSNGLAAGNCIEEAILHGVLEVIERDAVVINESNRVDPEALGIDGASDALLAAQVDLRRLGFDVSYGLLETDLPVEVFSAFVQSSRHADDCAVAFGCHLDPNIGLARALTESVQLLPPSANHETWLRSESKGRHSRNATRNPSVRLGDFPNLASGDLKQDIEWCVDALSKIGSEVVVVDLSDPSCPFPVVRVLATQLQPVVHDDDLRISPRLFRSHRVDGETCSQSKSPKPDGWPLIGYR